MHPASQKARFRPPKTGSSHPLSDDRLARLRLLKTRHQRHFQHAAAHHWYVTGSDPFGGVESGGVAGIML